MTDELLIEINDKLEAIRKILVIQNIANRGEIKRILNEEFLTTERRKKIYNMFNGKNSIGEIAKKTGITNESVRLLVDHLEKVCAIEILKKRGKTKYPLKIIL